MSKHIKRFFLFLLPILGKAAIQVAADELAKHAYPDQPRRRSYSNLTHHYHPYAPRSVRYRPLSEERRIARSNALKGRRGGPIRPKAQPAESVSFHDVLLVAFDLSGPNAEDTHRWLMDNMPAPGPGGDNDEIYLDAWWVADDDRFDGSDTDSAVFVPKGHQEHARAILDAHDLDPD